MKGCDHSGLVVQNRLKAFKNDIANDAFGVLEYVPFVENEGVDLEHNLYQN
ncbi:hypothetical protein [Sulfurirhabdus autotrophica]|uniref:hypothetical protein n=1 Tax=Sulfurirhabdus autotrophica TaxID=1706046 RepID=UPI0014054CDF|nr:hypothetical protein [Sulfurirhabdus autotrophica]